MKRYKSKYKYTVSFADDVKPPYEITFLDYEFEDGSVSKKTVTLDYDYDFTFERSTLYTEEQLFKKVLVKTDKIGNLVNDPTK